MVNLLYYYFLFFYFCEIRVPALSFSQQFDNFICFSVDIQYFLHFFILFPLVISHLMNQDLLTIST